MHKVDVDSTQNRAKMPPRKEEFLFHSLGGWRRFLKSETNNNPKQKHMFAYQNQYGVSTPIANLMKAGVDQMQAAPRWMPILAKCAISANIADPIDREKECRCAAIDCRASISHYLTELLRFRCTAPDSIHRQIDEMAVSQEQIVAAQAEAYRERQHRENMMRYISPLKY